VTSQASQPDRNLTVHEVFIPWPSSIQAEPSWSC
jgi:hypothetical protein